MSEQKDKFRVLAESHGLVADDFFKAPQGFWIIKRQGVEKIQRSMGCVVHYEVVPEFSDVEKGFYCIKAYAMVEYKVANEKTGKLEEEVKTVESYGEASLKNCRNAYPVAMAEKRALGRVVLKMADFYQLGVYSEDEIDE